MRKYTTLLVLGLLSSCLLSSCFASDPVNSNSKPIAHDIWNLLLKQHVDEKGLVNYQGFIEDSTQLNEYLQSVKTHHPNDENWNKNEQLAYWINAYNAFTVQLIIRHYPVESIKDIAGNLTFINTAWDLKFITIEGETYDLNNIEHGIIRKQFNEPRIHFALVCAAYSCPPLRNEAYTAAKLNAQLANQAKRFINDPTKNKIESGAVQLSKLFSWYKGDFTQHTDLLSYLNQYSEITISNDAEIDYLDYNWSLNAQPQ